MNIHLHLYLENYFLSSRDRELILTNLNINGISGIFFLICKFLVEICSAVFLMGLEFLFLAIYSTFDILAFTPLVYDTEKGMVEKRYIIY